jgi:hypothetical protein
MTEKEAQKFISERDRLGKELKLLQLEEHIKCLKRELNEAREEVERLRKALECMSLQRDELLASPLKPETRPEPSRLEIASLLFATGTTGNYGKDALDMASALIKASKEVAK